MERAPYENIVAATDVPESFLQLFGQHDLSAAAELGMLNLDATAGRKAVQMQETEAQRWQQGCRRTVSAPASIEYGSHAGKSDYLVAHESAAESHADDQVPVLDAQPTELFGSEYDESLEDDYGDDFEQDDLEDCLIDIASRQRSSDWH